MTAAHFVGDVPSLPHVCPQAHAIVEEKREHSLGSVSNAAVLLQL